MVFFGENEKKSIYWRRKVGRLETKRRKKLNRGRRDISMEEERKDRS